MNKKIIAISFAFVLAVVSMSGVKSFDASNQPTMRSDYLISAEESDINTDGSADLVVKAEGISAPSINPSQAFIKVGDQIITTKFEKTEKGFIFTGHANKDLYLDKDLPVTLSLNNGHSDELNLIVTYHQSLHSVITDGYQAYIAKNTRLSQLALGSIKL